MPNFTETFSTTTLTNTAESANNTETVVATLTGVVPPYPGMTIRISGWLSITTGTGTTASTLRIRRGSLTGTLVGPANAENQQIAASKVCEQTIEADDTPGEGNFTYVLTQQGTGDTGVPTYNNARLRAQVT